MLRTARTLLPPFASFNGLAGVALAAAPLAKRRERVALQAADTRRRIVRARENGASGRARIFYSIIPKMFMHMTSLAAIKLPAS